MVRNPKAVELAPHGWGRCKGEPEKATRLFAASDHTCNRPVAVTDNVLNLELKRWEGVMDAGEIAVETRTTGRDPCGWWVEDQIGRHDAMECRGVAGTKRLVHGAVEIVDDALVSPRVRHRGRRVAEHGGCPQERNSGKDREGRREQVERDAMRYVSTLFAMGLPHLDCCPTRGRVPHGGQSMRRRVSRRIWKMPWFC